MPTETEIKMQIPDGVAHARLFEAPEIEPIISGTVRTMDMFSRYYDTPDGALSARRWSLRLRDEGGAPVASLKTSSSETTEGVFSRSEWQARAAAIDEGIEALIAEGAPDELRELCSGGLEERCAIKFTRSYAILKPYEGMVVEMACDNGFILADGKQEPFNELEFELLFGRAEELMPLCAVLIERFGLMPERRSKYERALKLIRSRQR